MTTFRKAVAVRDDDAVLLGWLGTALSEMARWDEAERVKRRALAIDEASYGPDHPNVARDLNNLAALLQATNRLSEAEPLMRRALAILEASLGGDAVFRAVALVRRRGSGNRRIGRLSPTRDHGSP